jgi:hypothetical protein
VSLPRHAARVAVLVVIAAATACGKEAPLTDESRAREAWVRQLSEREDLVDTWSLTSRSDLQFEDGLSGVEMTDPAKPFTGWREAAHVCTTAPALPVRWMGARSHLRLRGESDMELEIRGRANLPELLTRPLITASLNGREIHAALVDEDGYFRIAATVPHAMVREWSDLYITLSSVHEPWRDPNGMVGGKLMVSRIEHVTWQPASR